LSAATKLGFVKIDDIGEEFIIKESEISFGGLKEVDSHCDSERLSLLKQRAFYAFKILYKISDELLMTVNDDRGLKELANNVKEYTAIIEDIELENSNNK